MKSSPNTTIIRPDLRFRFNKNVSTVTIIAALPFLVIIVLGFFRHDGLTMLIILGVALALVGLGYTWIRWAHKVVLGPGYVRVRWGLRSKTIQVGTDVAAVKIGQVYASLFTTVDPETGWLFLGQGKTRVTMAYINSADATRIIEHLGSPAVFTGLTLPNGQLLEKPTGNYWGAMPLWVRRPGLFGLLIAVVLIAGIVVYAIFAVNAGNDTYRQEATPRVKQAAARYELPGWRPASSPVIEWADGTDHSGLAYRRTFSVPYKSNEEFLTAWEKFTGEHNPVAHDLCDDYTGHNFDCTSVAHTYVDGHLISIDARYEYITDDDEKTVRAPQVELTLTDSRSDSDD